MAAAVRDVGKMEDRCLGQEDRNLQVVERVCPTCGAEVEFFGNETKVKCYKCGRHVLRENEGIQTEMP